METTPKKRIKVFILVNCLTSVNSQVYGNHCHFFTYTAKAMPHIDFMFYPAHRMSIDNARNSAAKMALEAECDYLMFIDDDVLIPPATLELLLAADKDIIAGLVMIRGYPFNVMAFKHGEKTTLDGREVKTLEYFNDLEYIDEDKKVLKELQECDAIGFSCALIKCDILKPLEPPYFLTGRYHTEDVYFCMKVKEALDPKPEIYLHTGIQCGHVLNPEPIEWSTKEAFKKFYEEMGASGPTTEPKRDEDYMEACLAELDAIGKPHA